MTTETTEYCGHVSLVGRPNVGKSTLLNRLIGEKISITSRKPQTTRQRILGLDTQGAHQIIYVDTPGLHLAAKAELNRFMNQEAEQSLQDVDIVLFLIDARYWTDEDQWVLNKLRACGQPVVLLLNKIDQIQDKSDLLAIIDGLQQKADFHAVVPISAQKGINLEPVRDIVTQALPQRPHLYDADQLTDRNDRFLVAELIREKVFRMCGDELPYSTGVHTEAFVWDESMYRISAIIYVERPGQKKILIGKEGEKLKQIATQARIEIERLLDAKVYLKLWVKVKTGSAYLIGSDVPC